MIRRAPLKRSMGTVWPAEVRAHVYTHQHACIGPLAGMLGNCDTGDELDHIRSSGAVGKKSKSIATNGARLCHWHHAMKTEYGRTWRPRLLDVVRSLYRDCVSCSEEWAREWEAVNA